MSVPPLCLSEPFLVVLSLLPHLHRVQARSLLNDGPIIRYLRVDNTPGCSVPLTVTPCPSICFCFDPIFELYLGCRPVVFPLITRRKLSIKSVKWDAASGLNGRTAICSNSAAFKVLTVCFLGPYVTINLRLGSAALKNEKPDCFCLVGDDGGVIWRGPREMSPSAQIAPVRAGGRVTVFRNNFLIDFVINSSSTILMPGSWDGEEGRGFQQ